MENLRDSIAAKLKEWSNANEIDKTIYSPEELSTRAYQASRLNELKKIYLKFYAAKENRNNAALNPLKIKVDLLTKKLHRGFARRLWERVKDSIRLRGFVKGVLSEQQKDYDQLRSFVNQTNLDHDYMPQINIGAKEINIRHNQYYQMSQTAIMNCDYRITRSSEGFDTTAYTVRILSTDDPSNVKEVKFQHRSHQWLNNDQLYSLASGRPVLHVDQQGNQRWLMLNQLDKDKDGNTQVIQVGGADFSVEEAIRKSHLNGILAEQAGDTLIKKLHDGKIVEVVDKTNGNRRVYHVQADPLRRRIDILEDPGTRVARKDNRINHGKSYSNSQATTQKRKSNTTGQSNRRVNKKPQMKVVKR